MSVQLNSEKVRQELAVRGWSATDLAKRAGIGRSTVNQALLGRSIAIGVAKKIADAFDDHAPDANLADLLAEQAV